MKLTLKNIAKIEYADVELNGITVIAGENNTGKSTVGKALYCIINSCCRCEEKIHQYRVKNIDNIIFKYLLRGRRVHRYREESEYISTEKILGNIDRYVENPRELEEELIKLAEAYYISEEHMEEKIDAGDITDRIITALKVSDKDVLMKIVFNNFNDEFNGQVNNIFKDEKGTVDFEKDSKAFSVSFENNSPVTENIFEITDEAVYIDDPFILDEEAYFGRNSILGHKENLKRRLYRNLSDVDIIGNIVAEKKLQNIYGILNNICEGNVVRKQIGLGYKKDGTDKILDVKNLSTGLKTFAILKTLLQNGTLQEKSILILDEPEIHLHPKWQLLFAELIVLIQKEFNMHILLNTHSPYFMKAIEVFTAKYEIADKCKYYSAYMNNESSLIEDVTGNTEEIYRLLARPLQDLENMRYEND